MLALWWDDHERRGPWYDPPRWLKSWAGILRRRAHDFRVAYPLAEPRSRLVAAAAAMERAAAELEVAADAMNQEDK